jgi:hypothetical protein
MSADSKVADMRADMLADMNILHVSKHVSTHMAVNNKAAMQHVFLL